MSRNQKRSDCPISCSLDIWGDKWSLLIVRDLMDAKQCTYGDFLKSPEKIATNILPSRLQSLEEFEIIERKMYYQLTIKGIDLVPIMIEITAWADKYATIPKERKALLRAYKKDKEGFIKASIKELKKV